MRVPRSLLGLALLAGFSSNALADVYLCSDDSGKVSAHNQACPAKAPDPDQSAAYAAMSNEQYYWYFAQVECIDRTFYDGGYDTGDLERMRLINRRVALKNLPVYFDEQFETAKAKRTDKSSFDMGAYMDAYSECDRDLFDHPEPNTGSSVTLLSRLQLDGLATPNSRPAFWMNWAYSRANESLELVASRDQTAYFTSGEGFFHAVDLSTGGAQWRFDAGSEVLETLVGEERIYLLTAELPHIRVLERATGKVVNRYKAETPVQNLHEVGDLLLFEESSETAEHLVAVDRQSLAERWRVPLATYSSDSLTVFNNTVLVSNDEYLLYAFDAATGKLRWKQQMAEGGELKVGAALYYQDSANSTLQTLSADSGKTVATFNYGEDDYTKLDADAQRFYKTVDDSGKLQAIDLASGKPLWTLPLTQESGLSDLQVSGPSLLLLDGFSTSVQVVDKQTGKVTGTVHIPSMNFSDSRDAKNTLLTRDSAVLIFPR